MIAYLEGGNDRLHASEPSRRSEALKIPEQSQSKSLDPSKSTDQLTTLLVGEHDRPGMGKRHHIARVRRKW